eukprot:scaffold13285_cov87-Skeletonema_dohrnii-CCMP3373.AAC.1
MDQQETEWIEAPDGWGDDAAQDESSDSNHVLDIFGNTDPRESFDYKIKIGEDTKTIVLHGFKLDSDETDRSTGVTLWQAAPRLSEYLQAQPDILLQKRVLEVGAGLGLCGITAHWLGAKEVIMTDGDSHALKQMRANVNSNCKSATGDGDDVDHSTITCRQLLWGTAHAQKFFENNGQQNYDIILGADVIYTESSIEPLLDTVACLLQKPDGRFVLSRHNKWFSIENDMIIELAKKRHLNCTIDAESEGILIFHWGDK